ncbi:hypothetical protein BVX98_03355, partial [bacterium F11]
ATAILLLAIRFLWAGTKYLQQAMSQHIRLQRLNAVLAISQDIAQQVRESKRIIDVNDDFLDLEVYNHQTYTPLDPALYTHTKRVRYQFHSVGEKTYLFREIYSSTMATTPQYRTSFLKNVELMAPSPDTPLFYASYLVGGSTVGIKLDFGIKAPFSKERWAPIKEEVYVQAALY